MQPVRGHCKPPIWPMCFAKGDPYVTQGIVNKWWVRKWDTVVGKDAANPLPELE